MLSVHMYVHMDVCTRWEKQQQQQQQQQNRTLVYKLFLYKRKQNVQKLPMWANLRMLALRWWKNDEIW